MNKKFLALLLCAAMVLASLTACGKKNETPDAGTDTNVTTQAPETTQAPANETTPAVQLEEVPDAAYYFSFDESAGTAGIRPTAQDKSQSGADILQPADKEVKFMPGVKGDALYVDGSTGYKLDVNGVGETYTIDFWLYARRFANYMPTLQFGPDVHGDATGNQHYLNITSAEWSGSPSFPCVWAYDQAADGLWPNWSLKDSADQHIGEWMNIALVVDPSKVSIDGTCIMAELYVNGERFDLEDLKVVFGTMAPSDNFDFLVGVNYWDAIFKGAVDELYIFDKVLTPGQIKTLYSYGDPTVKFQEPERIIVVTPDEAAIESIGAVDYSNAFGTEFTSPVAVADGETWKIKVHNWSDGKDTKNNYSLVFTAAPSENPLADAVAVVNADATGEGAAANADFTYSWGNWNTWEQNSMVDVTTTLTIKRDGETVKIEADNVDFNVASQFMTVSFNCADANYVYLTCGNCYLDVLQVKNATVKATTGTIVGNTDLSTGWWTSFSDIWAVPAGTSKTMNFTNYTDGAANWDNFVVILQNTPTGHGAAEAEGYAEYAVVRADNFGWGAGYDGIVTPECDWNWDTFASDMDGAEIELTVSNDGTTATIYFEAATASGMVYHQTYAGIPVDGDNVFFCLSCEKSFLVLPAPQVVGATDLSSGWWTEFSDIYAVPAGTAKEISFTNFTDGATNWDNFVVILQNTPAGHSAETTEGYAEYAVVRADNFGWGVGYDGIVTPECDWNWDTFTSDMDGAQINLKVSNNGTDATIFFTATTTEGKTYRQTYAGIPVDGDNVYFCLGLEKAYLLIEGPQTVGATDLTAGWWTTFSKVVPVEEGTPLRMSFTNYTDGAANWDNFVVILQNTPYGHGAAEAEGYAEYAVVRADNFGWGAGYDGIAAAECDWNWDTFPADMDGARIFLTVTNNGSTADISFVAGTQDGKVYHQSYTGIAVDGPVYACLGLEKAYLQID